MLEEFITLNTLSEFPVLVIVVGMITQVTKRALDWVFSHIFNIVKMPTEIISFFIAIIILLSMSYVNGDFLSINSKELVAVILMDILNAFIVSLAANKGYERATSDKSVITRIQFKKNK